MNKIEGVIFDWAGTTVDFGCFAPVRVFIEIFKDAGIEVTMAEAREPMGVLKIDHVRALMKMPRIERLWEEKYGQKPNEEDVHRLYANFEPMLLKTLSNYTDVKEEVVDTVNGLREAGIKIGSTTGYTNSMMEVVTKEAKEKGYAPDFWITPDATESYGRPYPYMIYRNMEALKISSRHQVIKVGDTVADIKEGISAGVWTVGVLVGSSEMGLDETTYKNLSDQEKQDVLNHIHEKFEQAGADFTVETMGELPDLIEKINRLLAAGKRPNAK